MEKQLKVLGLNEKQIQVFLYLVEYGISPASEIARTVALPKSSVNFLCDGLWEEGYLKKSFRGKVGFYEIDIQGFQDKVTKDISLKEEALEQLIPVLKEKSKDSISKPRIIFIDGVENCKRYYQELLLLSGKTFYEFGAHKDLEQAFGKKFMKDFIDTRVERKIFCDSIGTNGEVEIALQKLDSLQYRSLKIFEKNIYGNISSSIAIYDDTVLILHLGKISNGIMIKNQSLADTIKTIFMICKG